VAESSTICSSRSGRPVPVLLDTSAYIVRGSQRIMHNTSLPNREEVQWGRERDRKQERGRISYNCFAAIWGDSM